MLDWDHNAYYHRLLLRQLPPASRRVLDVGCGAGTFAARLAQRVETVDALDLSPVMIEAAQQRTPANVNCLLADALTDPLPASTYDAIFSISALHHMSLHDALPRFAAVLRPGGALAAVALPKVSLARELPHELIATIGHRVLGSTFLIARSLGVAGSNWFAHEPTHETMPVVMNPALTTHEVQRQASMLLPGARVRRLVFWRYLLLWRKPREPTDMSSAQPRCRGRPPEQDAWRSVTCRPRLTSSTARPRWSEWRYRRSVSAAPRR